MHLTADLIAQLRSNHRGDIITPEDPSYDRARRVWNAMIDRRPAVVARPRSAADVIAAVNFARTQRLPLAIRGGAHNVAGRSTCDDGVVIDFSHMKGIRVDPVARTVRAEPGLKWHEFDRETQTFGLATTGGTVGDTGIAGLTLGGGFGWLEGRCGMTVDNLLGADVVLATGELVHASDTEHPDLFWALRGGGGNFGVVTSFEYRLHPIGPMIIGGLVAYPIGETASVLRAYNEFMRSAPDDLVAAAVLMTAPDGHPACGIAAAYAGDLADGERAVAPLKTLGTVAMDLMGPLPYTAMQGLLEQAMPPDKFNYWKAGFVQEVSDDVIGVAVDSFSRVLSPLSSILFFPIRGAASRVPTDATAFPHRGGYTAGFYALWDDPADHAGNMTWVREGWSALQPLTTGAVYVNELGEDDDDRILGAYGFNYERLARIKAKYDPQNLFCLNANIAPVA